MAPPPFDGYEEDLLDDEVLQDEEEEWVELGDEGAPGFRAALFSSQAGLYARYRPNYPPHVYQRIYDFAEVASGGVRPGQGSQELALDIGCGPGNVTVELAKTYVQVVGVDPSKDQLDHAIQGPNIRYAQVAAEFLAHHLPPRSVDLIAMAETLHWLDHLRFYEQARLILKPTGCLAIWCYDLAEFEPNEAHPDAEGAEKANALMRAYTYSVIGPFWDNRRTYIDRRYAGLEPLASQFRVVERADMRMEHMWSMDHFVGFLRSWSPYAAFRKTYPDKEDPLVDLRAQLNKLLGVTDDAAATLRVTFPVFLLLIRDPVQPELPPLQRAQRAARCA